MKYEEKLCVSDKVKLIFVFIRKVFVNEYGEIILKNVSWFNFQNKICNNNFFKGLVQEQNSCFSITQHKRLNDFITEIFLSYLINVSYI